MHSALSFLLGENEDQDVGDCLAAYQIYPVETRDEKKTFAISPIPSNKTVTRGCDKTSVQVHHRQCHIWKSTCKDADDLMPYFINFFKMTLSLAGTSELCKAVKVVNIELSIKE